MTTIKPKLPWGYASALSERKAQVTLAGETEGSRNFDQRSPL
jgi:hypothetical protein